jgi:hypothetical protein
MDRGLLAVDGIAKELPGGGNCLHFNARLVTPCDSVIDQQIGSSTAPTRLPHTP